MAADEYPTLDPLELDLRQPEESVHREIQEAPQGGEPREDPGEHHEDTPEKRATRPPG